MSTFVGALQRNTQKRERDQDLEQAETSKRQNTATDATVESDLGKVRLEQIFVIYEGCFSLYFMTMLDGPEIVPLVLLEACTYLEKVRGQNPPFPITHKNIAEACLLVAMQFWCEHIGNFKIDLFLEAFQRCDKGLTKKTLSRAQKWVLERLDYGLWYTRQNGTKSFLEVDQDFEERSLVEMGFLAEQSLFPCSMSTDTFQDCKKVSEFISQHQGYKGLQQRLRSFCADTNQFRKEFFGWSFEPKYKIVTSF
jgi:hypothetical protein